MLHSQRGISSITIWKASACSLVNHIDCVSCRTAQSQLQCLHALHLDPIPCLTPGSHSTPYTWIPFHALHLDPIPAAFLCLPTDLASLHIIWSQDIATNVFISPTLFLSFLHFLPSNVYWYSLYLFSRNFGSHTGKGWTHAGTWD